MNRIAELILRALDGVKEVQRHVALRRVRKWEALIRDLEKAREKPGITDRELMDINRKLFDYQHKLRPRD